MELTIVYFGDQWDALWRRRQQIAYRLARLPEVQRLVYVEFPLTWPSLWKTALGRAPAPTRQRWARVMRAGRISSIGGVCVATPITPLSPAYPGPLTGLSNRLWAPQVRHLVRRAARATDRPPQRTILWATHPLAAPYLADLPDAFVCYDANDRFDQLAGWDNLARQILRYDEDLTRRAGLVFTQVKSEGTRRRAANPHTYVMPNGVDYDLYERASRGEPPACPPADIASIPRPVLGYVGNIDDRLDYDLLCRAAASRLDWSFVFVGPVGPAARPEEVERLRRLPNAWLLGGKPYHELPSYLQCFDVSLLAHRVQGLTESQSPLKLFDYLAVGKPIVSTPVAGLDGLRSHVYVAASTDEFICQVELALRETDVQRARSRRLAAESNSWEVRVAQMWSLVRERMAHA